MERKKVAIILPNFNSDKYLVRTLNSVISQTLKEWRLYIVDDNSNQKTIKILKKYKNNKKIKIFYLKKNMGPGYCRNLAIEKSKSEYLAFIDSDDLWATTKLSDQIKFMEKKNIEFSYTNYKTISTRKNKIKNIIVPDKFDYKTFIKNTSIATSTMVIKRQIFKKIKFTDTKICEDFFYKCQLLKKIDYAYRLNKYLTKYRIRQGSLQSKKMRNLFWIWKINKEFNKLNVLDNLISIFFISLNSFKKYGLK